MARSNPPHGGYPTPTYDEAPARRRAESLRLFGHMGAACSTVATRVMHLAGLGLAGTAPGLLEARIQDGAAERQRVVSEWDHRVRRG